MSALTRWLDRTFYPGFDNNWDDQLLRQEILRSINSSSVILDLGAGAGIVAAMNFRGFAGRVCGIDLDPRVLSNPMLDEGRIIDAVAIPYPEASFDLVFSDNVLEHLENPQAVFDEIVRVLKPGGRFVFKTPNRTHYMPMIARYTPTAFHRFVNRLRGRADVDTFPTLYAANSRSAITGLAKASGLMVESIEHFEGRPEYLRIAFPFYLFGVVYERFVNSSALFEKFRIVIVGKLRKG